MRALIALGAALLMAGCASFSDDGGFGPVQQAAREQLGAELRWARDDAARQAIDTRVAELLAQPLDVESAVQLALLNHRGLQARFASLGLAEAEFVRASRLPNPGFSFGRMMQGDEREIERGLHLNLARWLVTPWMSDLQGRQMDLTRQTVLQAVLDHAHQTRQAWVRAVAADQTVHYMGQVMQAAEASAELARRMQAVGNFNTLQRAREQAFYADAALNLARAEQQQRAARERLIRVLGLWGEQTAFRLPERLPELPPEPADRPALESETLAGRLDVRAAQMAVEQTGQSLGLTRSTRFINVVDLGLSYNSSNEAPVQRGWELEFELPIFDLGQTRVVMAEQVWRQALDRAAEVAIDGRSELREAYGQLRSAWAIARHHREHIVPLRAQIAEQNLLRYNGMLIGVFDLLADARVQIASVNAAIEAERDFWLAEADWRLAQVGPARASAAAGPSASAPAAAGGDPH